MREVRRLAGSDGESQREVPDERPCEEACSASKGDDGIPAVTLRKTMPMAVTWCLAANYLALQRQAEAHNLEM